MLKRSIKPELIIETMKLLGKGCANGSIIIDGIPN